LTIECPDRPYFQESGQRHPINGIAGRIRLSRNTDLVWPLLAELSRCFFLDRSPWSSKKTNRQKMDKNEQIDLAAKSSAASRWG
jgi:hypothetical protein